METLVWLRVPGDIVFSVGVLFLVLFAAKLFKGEKHNQAAPIIPGAALPG